MADLDEFKNIEDRPENPYAKNFIAKPPVPRRSRKVVLAWVLAGVLLGALLSSVLVDDAPAPAAPAVAVVPSTPVTRTPPPVVRASPRSAPVASSDYRDDGHYLAEMGDSGDKLSSLFYMVASIFGDTADGVYTPEEARQLLAAGRKTLVSHITFYEDRTPPAQFTVLNTRFIRVLRAYDNAFDLIDTCLVVQTNEACTRAYEALQSAVDNFNVMNDWIEEEYL